MECGEGPDNQASWSPSWCPGCSIGPSDVRASRAACLRRELHADPDVLVVIQWRDFISNFHFSVSLRSTGWGSEAASSTDCSSMRWRGCFLHPLSPTEGKILGSAAARWHHRPHSWWKRRSVFGLQLFIVLLKIFWLAGRAARTFSQDEMLL